MDVFHDVNEFSGGGHSEFRILTHIDDVLVMMGSFDLDYYHDVEVAFYDVLSSTCPTELRWPRFSDGGAANEKRRYLIADDAGDYEVVAGRVEVTFERVYHYDRGALLKPGERIAS
jgi:hypothetical protein